MRLELATYAGMMADPKTEELAITEVQRERAEREQARDAELPLEERIHERRADRHAYLREKLAEQAHADDQDEA
jgi:hypothetical protein